MLIAYALKHFGQALQSIQSAVSRQHLRRGQRIYGVKISTSVNTGR